MASTSGPGPAWAVGGAVGRNPIGLAIPCHRVIAGDATIGGCGADWFGSRDQLLEIKRELLEREGVRLPSVWIGTDRIDHSEQVRLGTLGGSRAKTEPCGREPPDRRPEGAIVS